MRVTHRSDPLPFQFRLELGKGAAPLATKPSLARLDFSVRLPPEVSTDIHPDLIALAILLCVRPFLPKPELCVEKGVTSGFAEAVRELLGVDLRPVDDSLLPRETEGRPCLSFSGGVDSTAALLALPSDTVCVFLVRHNPPGTRSSLYSPTAARHTCEILRERGYQVLEVETDLEHLRNPVGFPTDLATSVPAILLADHLGLDTMAWGTIAESAYRVGHHKFEEYYERSTYTMWAPLFAHVGLPILNPMAGVSEVGTSSIVRSQGLLDVAQSCTRGAPGMPCRDCWKCFRKGLLDAALGGSWPSDQEIDRLFLIREAARFLAMVPIKHENVVAYLAARYQGRHPRMLALAERVRAHELDLSYLERWYPPSAAPWPAKYREGVIEKVDGLLTRMTEADVAGFRAWDVSELEEDPVRNAKAVTYGEVVKARVAVAKAEPRVFSERPAPTLVDLAESGNRRRWSKRAGGGVALPGRSSR